MKEEKTKYNTTESRIQSNIQDVEPGKLIFIENRKVNGPAIPNYPTFGGISGKLCTGPPGRARSPGEYSPVRAEPKTDQIPVLSGHPLKANYALRHRSLSLSKGNTEYQVFSNNNKNHFFQTLNFKIMKKQILIIAFFVLALMAGSLSSFGQLVKGNLAPGASSCTSDALHPIAGTSYTYTIDNTNGIVPTNYSWWVTKNPNFVVVATGAADQSAKLGVAAGQLIATTANGATDGKSIDITWSPELLAATKYQGAAGQPTFVAVMTNGACTNNLQVYEINPKPSFTVDITNINTTGTTLAYTIDFPQCVAAVHSASYVANQVAMDYGTNTLYYEVISANFVTSWQPTFQIMAGSLSANQTADIYYSSTLADVKTNGVYLDSSLGLADGAVFASAKNLTSALANTSVGVSLYVKVVIHNLKEESLADRGFTLAVDGKDFTNQWDLVNTTCLDPAAADQSDKATQTITRRPDVTNAIVPAPAPNPATFVPKN
ncbi:MAG: hypothetical protein WCI54_05580 [Bacteroidia bacterium]